MIWGIIIPCRMVHSDVSTDRAASVCFSGALVRNILNSDVYLTNFARFACWNACTSSSVRYAWMKLGCVDNLGKTSKYNILYIKRIVSFVQEDSAILTCPLQGWVRVTKFITDKNHRRHTDSEFFNFRCSTGVFYYVLRWPPLEFGWQWVVRVTCYINRLYVVRGGVGIGS